MAPKAERAIDRWTRLRGSGQGDGALEVPSLASEVQTGFGPVRFAVGPEGQPRLLVPVAFGTKPLADSRGGKLSVLLTPFSVAGRNTVFIDITSQDRALDSVFAELAEEIVYRIAAGHAPAIAVGGTISDFKELLRDPDGPEVAAAQIVGLIGELLVLRMLVRISPSATSAWTGPYGQRHDFRRGEHAIEVKASARADATTVTISSIEQLSEPADGTLTLLHVRIERADQGALSVASLFRSILEAGADDQLLRGAIQAVGCPDPAAEEWNVIRFHLESLDAFRVEKGFPRICESSFANGYPPGVSQLQYDIDLLAAGTFKIPETELTAALQRIAL